MGRRADLDINSPSISRKHAIIDRQSGVWQVRDLDSRNGTFVNGQLVDPSAVLETGDRVKFGTARFILLQRRLEPAERKRAHFETQTAGRAQLPSADQVLGPEADVQLIALRQGAGGLLRFAGREIQLTSLQFALVDILVRKRHDDASEPSSVRGFVPSGELVARLPWDTRIADEINLRQLARRLRARFEPLGLTIEGRRGMGYRLRRSDD